MMEEYNINQTTLKILGLYRNDYKKSLHLRAIARETGVDVKAVQLQLKRLERTNLLTSQVQGRNKEYRLNLANLSGKYYMVIAEAYASILFLATHFPVKRILGEISDNVDGVIIIFGSQVKGGAGKESDIDLLALTSRKVDKGPVEEAGDLANRKVSLKSMTKTQFVQGLEKNDPLVREVTADHILLKGIDDFCEILWRYYA
jgi:predicted nucleotidyltransferase